MFIQPNTVVRILSGVPLDPSYDHTIFFPNTAVGHANQFTYFSGKTKYILNNQSYQRVKRGWLRVEIQAENLYDCNYIMFQNSSFGSKWFYAFIKSVEYVNNLVSEIEFELDVMQTWAFSYEPEMCFVEREHSVTDEPFTNTVPENLEIGDEYICASTDYYDMSDMSVCALVNKKTADGTATSRNINGIYTPMRVVAGVPATDVTAIDYLLDRFLENEIVCIYQYPSVLGDASTEQPVTVSKIISRPQNGMISGHTVRNKKLFSYPYIYLEVSNNSGQSAQFRWEDSDASVNLEFRITGVFVSTPCVMLYPYNYKGVQFGNFEEGLVMSNFPQCAWSGDTFKAWWAQNKNSFVTSAISSTLNAVTTGAMRGLTSAARLQDGSPFYGTATAMVSAGGAVVNAGVSVADTVASSVAKIRDIKAQPNQTYGHTQTDSLLPGLRRVRYDFYTKAIKKEYAEIIDDYFDRYGYACKRNKKPNRNSRPHWNYVKTVGCTITGSIPCNDADAICNIYNRGITFWKNGDEIGHYELDNSPVNGGS